MLIGYMRVSKADGSQVLDLQRDALLAAGVDIVRLYEDHASGHIDDRPGLDACLKSLRTGDTLEGVEDILLACTGCRSHCGDDVLLQDPLGLPILRLKLEPQMILMGALSLC